MSLLVSLDHFSKDLILWLLASAESGSEHPLARAILGYAQTELHTQEYGRCLEFELFPGLGLKSRISCGEQTRFGEYRLLAILPCLNAIFSSRVQGRIHCGSRQQRDNAPERSAHLPPGGPGPHLSGAGGTHTRVRSY